MMELKKNPKKDLTRNSGIHFVAGLAMVLSLTYVALEWKTFFEQPEYVTARNVEKELIEDAPIFVLETPPPPPPPVAPPIIEVVDNELDIEESPIDSSESNEEIVIMEVDSVEVGDEFEDADVPFILVEDAPIFPGCEDSSDKKGCFNKMILKHVNKTFRYPEIAQEMGVQGKVYIHFVIQKDGNIGNIQIARSPDKSLGNEGLRIIKKLPKMTPGKQRGNAVRVPFSIPINFVLQ